VSRGGHVDPRHGAGNGREQEHQHEALAGLGDACSDAANALLVDLDCKRVQCDEIWSPCYCKAENTPAGKKDGFGWGWPHAG
jgi:hypothetical protein